MTVILAGQQSLEPLSKHDMGRAGDVLKGFVLQNVPAISGILGLVIITSIDDWTA
jgi:hypothetical protein